MRAPAPRDPAGKRQTIQMQVKLRLRACQERLLERWLWHLAGVYNWTIRKVDQDASRWSFYDLNTELVGHGAKIGVPQRALNGTVETALLAWKRCFTRLAKPPRLKSRRNKLNSIAFSDGTVAPKNGRLRVPNIGWLRFHQQDIPDGVISRMRLVKRSSGWYACLWVRALPKPIAAGVGQIGIDPGFHSLLTLSTGEKVTHPRELECSAQRTAQAQRGHRHRLVARLQERSANQRKNRNHHLSRRLVCENAFIAFSADQHQAIARRFGKSVASSSHSELRRMLAYKCRSGGAQYVEVNPRNSTRTCSSCQALTGPTSWAGLKVREWACGACGAHHDRDVNAAINTLTVGLGMSHENSREAVSGTAIGATRQSPTGREEGLPA